MLPYEAQRSNKAMDVPQHADATQMPLYPKEVSIMRRIVIDENIRHGKPVIKGTRVPVDIILGSLAGGMLYQEVCEDYEITEDDIKAAIEYATKLVADEEVHLLEAVS